MSHPVLYSSCWTDVSIKAALKTDASDLNQPRQTQLNSRFTNSSRHDTFYVFFQLKYYTINNNKTVISWDIQHKHTNKTSTITLTSQTNLKKNPVSESFDLVNQFKPMTPVWFNWFLWIIPTYVSANITALMNRLLMTCNSL